MVNCIVVDDETLAREVLESYLSRLDFVGSVHSFGQAQEAFSYLQTHHADLLLLDIEMPHLNGLDFLTSLTKPPITIFTTAYRDYAFDGFELGVIDFLLKPIAFPRFVQALEKVRDFLALSAQNTNLEHEPAGPQSEFIFVKSGVQRVKLNFSDILYIQGLKDYAIIHTITGRIVIKGSIKAMSDIFPPDRFVRVHKSFVVALDRVTRIERHRLVLGGSQVPIGRSYKEEVTLALTGR